MSTFLLSWNPDNSSQNTFSDEYEKFSKGLPVVKSWSVTRSKKPKPGDRFYIIKVGKNAGGIFGSGRIISAPKELPHYKPEAAKLGQKLNFCDIEFDCLVDGYSQTLIGTEELQNINTNTGVSQYWVGRSSGIQIDDGVLKYLDRLWKERTDTLAPVSKAGYVDAAVVLDERIEGLKRIEQSFLRFMLFRVSKYGACCICGENMPVQLLVCAHIKKRSKCTDEEKKDYRNIVAPMCRFGCDELYERGYISVKDGQVVRLANEYVPTKVEAYLKDIVGNLVSEYDSESKKYFDWHYEINSYDY